MRHRMCKKMPATSDGHRKFLLNRLSTDLIVHGQLYTTLPKAKALRPYVEKVITVAKKLSKNPTQNDRVSIIRRLESKVKDDKAKEILIQVIPRLFEWRDGGYTRILKCGYRKSDCAPMAIIQLVLEGNGYFDMLCDYKNCNFKNQYKSIINYCLTHRIPSKKAVQKWAEFIFPKLDIKLEKLDGNAVRTTVNIAKDHSLSKIEWPRMRGNFLHLSVVVIFDFPGETQSVGISDLNSVHNAKILSSASGLTAEYEYQGPDRFAFSVHPQHYSSKELMVFDHRFSQGMPDYFVVSIAGPNSIWGTKRLN